MKTADQQSRANEAALAALLRDVELLAEAATDTILQLKRLGIPEHARPLERALSRLGG